MLFRRRDNGKHFAVENLTKTFLLIRLIKKGKFVPVLNYNQALRHDGVWGSGYIDPYFLELDISWR
jgi:hypothetical protein